jgi:hypothetical protein
MLLCYAAQRTCMLLAWCPVTNIKYCMHIHHNNNPNNTKQIYRNDWEMGQTDNNLWPSMKNYQDLAKKEIAFCKDHDLSTDFQNLKVRLQPHYQLLSTVRLSIIWPDNSLPITNESSFRDQNRLYIAWTTELRKEIVRSVRHYGN